MKRLIIVILAAGAVMFTATSVASAAPINECGSLELEDERVDVRTCAERLFPWQPDHPQRVLRLARKLVRSANGLGAYGFRCRTTTLGDEYWDVRCTASRGGVIRYQTGV